MRTVQLEFKYYEKCTRETMRHTEAISNLIMLSTRCTTTKYDNNNKKNNNNKKKKMMMMMMMMLMLMMMRGKQSRPEGPACEARL